ncbi:glycoside hydrolase family 3 N-terminal domain-containing protein [Dinghuibacter silviterrae]|uniref:beta-glucosidase n=1 Tax=Dinghuibacter silviterrae TaxID=1539049 RepID=A0A4R8DQ13_9BACT|nr:glycoside hydrolase family 3 N-terminal domain-containing protein [Dinghuibacter silviterrae]TDW99210.1 beta-glucosidase [Dinghuibacter silviterrae]
MRAFLSALFLASVSFASAQSRVDDLLSKMTLEEKIGQMTQVTLDVVLRPGVHIDTAKLKQALETYHVGSILNTAGHALSRDQWKELITDIQKEATGHTRLHIPVIYGIDAIHGVNYVLGATLFPQEIGQAATFNPELVRKAADITAYETRAAYIPWNFSPVLDLGKSPLWPRMYETYGEDPYLCKTMGAEAVKGYQGSVSGAIDKYHVAACMKHYLGYSYPLSGKDRTPAWIPDRYMREYFLPSFREAVKAGARTVMVNSSQINGVPVHASHYLLTDVLRGELGFDGVIVTDWQDIKYLHDRHHIAATQEDAVLMAINAGIDMSMVPYDFSFYTYLLDLVKTGKVSVARIDASVRRILRLKEELGLFALPVPHTEDYPDFGSEASRQVSLQAAEESITLLKNNNAALPLKTGARILVTGPTANTLRSVDGGWSYSWQGDVNDALGAGHATFLDALRKKLGSDHVVYADSLSDALSAAAGVDAIVLFLGESSYAENPGNIDDLDLPFEQLHLAAELAKTGKPVILVLAEGRPRIVTSADAVAAATLTVYYPGNEGGEALADILTGDVNPSGKLPFTYPRYANALVNYYRKFLENGNPDDQHGFHPLYEFGSGLSYTTFTYSHLRLSSPVLSGNGSLQVSVDVQNTGQREGKESVLLYTSQWYASISPDVKRLRAFRKIDLQPGETKTVTFALTPSDLAFIGDDNKPVTEPGQFTIRIGDQTVDFTYQSSRSAKPSEGRL